MMRIKFSLPLICLVFVNMDPAEIIIEVVQCFRNILGSILERLGYEFIKAAVSFLNKLLSAGALKSRKRCGCFKE